MIAKNVTVGKGCTLNKDAYIGFGEHGGSIVIGDRVRVRHNVIIRSCTGNIKIGNSVVINYGCIMHGLGGITIGNQVVFSPNVQVYAQNHGISKSKSIMSQKNIGEGIVIGNDVWLGASVIVCDGVTIGNGVVVGAGSIVTKSIPDYEIWAGNPAKKIGVRK